mmetsp:Transcript_40071/g.45768  ORF Transcript_40071/g.45768 Transcript_40071/m.45768 type:complete len:83 (+) Transcript_40071:593-841(+)
MLEICRKPFDYKTTRSRTVGYKSTGNISLGYSHEISEIDSQNSTEVFNGNATTFSNKKFTLNQCKVGKEIEKTKIRKSDSIR